MAYSNYGMTAQQPVQPPMQPGIQQNLNTNPFSQQNVQPLFPQPQGNVYNINSTLEVANVPVGAGISVALCLPENVMYIKTMQNGNPLFYPYKVIPFSNDAPVEQKDKENQDTSISLDDLIAQIKRCNEKIEILEEKLNKKKKEFDL